MIKEISNTIDIITDISIYFGSKKWSMVHLSLIISVLTYLMMFTICLAYHALLEHGLSCHPLLFDFLYFIEIWCCVMYFSYMPDLRQVTEFRQREVIHCHKVSWIIEIFINYVWIKHPNYLLLSQRKMLLACMINVLFLFL